MRRTGIRTIGEYTWRRFRHKSSMMDTLEIPVHELSMLGVRFRVDEWGKGGKPMTISLNDRKYNYYIGDAANASL